MNPRKSDSNGTKRFSRVACLPILLLLAIWSSNCSQAADNPLIGDWKFTRLTGTASCASTSVFKDNVAIISYPATPYAEARVANVPVIRYMPSATLVVALTGGKGIPMNHENYTFVDKNHMWTETAYGKCYYERTK